MKHDGREAGNDCDSGSFLMSPTLGSGKTQWSPCSKQYLDAFLKYVQIASILACFINLLLFTARCKQVACGIAAGPHRDWIITHPPRCLASVSQLISNVCLHY